MAVACIEHGVVRLEAQRGETWASRAPCVRAGTPPPDIRAGRLTTQATRVQQREHAVQARPRWIDCVSRFESPERIGVSCVSHPTRMPATSDSPVGHLWGLMPGRAPSNERARAHLSARRLKGPVIKGSPVRNGVAGPSSSSESWSAPSPSSVQFSVRSKAVSGRGCRSRSGRHDRQTRPNCQNRAFWLWESQKSRNRPKAPMSRQEPF